MNQSKSALYQIMLITLLVFLATSVVATPVSAAKPEPIFNYGTFIAEPVPNDPSWHFLVTDVNWDRYQNAKYLRLGALSTTPEGVTTDVFISSISISNKSYPYPQNQDLDGFSSGVTAVSGSQFTPYIELINAKGTVLVRLSGPFTYNDLEIH